MKNLIYLFCFTCLLILFSGNYAFSQWSQNWKWSMGNPTGDDIRYIQMLSETEWVGLGFNGGMIRTTNGGLNWTSRSDVTGYTGYNPPRIRDGWFFDSNNGFATGDQNLNGVISRTTNGGQTWSNVILPTTTITSIYFLNSVTGYAVGIYLPSAYKTTNGGLNWNAMNMNGTDQFQDIFALDANNVYAVGGKNFYKSTDGGTVWTSISTTINYASHFSVYFKDQNTGFIGGDAGSFYFTSDGGNSWIPRPAPVTEQLMKDIQFNDPEILLVGDKNNIYRTTDYGLSWNSLNFSSSSPPDNIVSSMYSIDKTGNNIVITGFTGLIYKSSDDGNTWSTISSSKHNSYLSGIYANSASGRIWVVGDAGPSSVLYSSDFGSSWSTNFGGAPNTNFRDIDFLNDNTGYICGEGGSIIKTTNGGENWTSIPSITIQAANAIQAVDNNVVLAGCNNGVYLRSTNSGLNFTLVNAGISFQDFSFIDSNTGWSVAGGRILKTKDKGSTWELQFTHTSNLLRIDMVDGNNGFACGWAGSLFKTTNGGVNWNQIPSQIPNNLTGLDFADANTGFVVSGGGFGIPGSAMRTTNGGATWQIINAGTNPLYCVTAVHPDTAIAVGYANIVKYTGPASSFKMNLTMNFELCPEQDTLTVELRSNVSPYNLIESRKGPGGHGESGLINFYSVSNGTPYYIAVKHRNSITTWSSSPVSFSGFALNYDFTTAASQAYGDNMKNSNSLWSFYQGDVNQDGEVSLSDVLTIYNDASNYANGPYLVSDLNCDHITDLSDIIPAFNNSSAFISVQRP
ncbi:MAG TPA: YCF48-related protein [Ignavibacteria bacterium]|nr:YCF48-related protein [Ignavibacteria bacterium]